MKGNVLLKLSSLLFMFSIILGCSSAPKIKDEVEMIQPILDSEYEKIMQSIPESSPITVWWCVDERFGSDFRSDISAWVQRSFEKMLVDSKMYRVVTRIHLEKVRKEHEFQMNAYVDDDTKVSITKIMGAKYLIVPTITRYNTLDVQILNSETSEIVYVSNIAIKKINKKK